MDCSTGSIPGQVTPMPKSWALSISAADRRNVLGLFFGKSLQRRVVFGRRNYKRRVASLLLDFGQILFSDPDERSYFSSGGGSHTIFPLSR